VRVLITGGAGFVGSHIVDRLLARKDQVLVLDNLSSGKKSNVPSGADLVQMDITDPKVYDAIAAFKPDLVTHCAAQASVVVSMEDPIHDATTNILGSINMLNASVKAGVPQFLYINTGGALYGDPERNPCREEDAIRPISPYGLSKWTFEQYLRVLAPETITVKVLRLANVFGPRQDPKGEAGVIGIFGLRMLKGQPVTIYGDGEQTRDFIFVTDVARAHEKAQLHNGPVTVNVSTNKATSVNEVTKLLTAEAGYKLKPGYAPARRGEVKRIVLDNTRARKQLGWAPEVSLKDGLRQTVAWLKSQA